MGQAAFEEMASDRPVESGNPADDVRAFRRALGHFATGVTVITADAAARPVGLTANSFSSVSLDPPLILWSADKRSTSLPAFLKATHFAINILSSEQTAEAANFAGSGGDKFATVAFTRGLGSAPVLAGVAASFECRREVEYDAGDHIIFIGRVDRYARYDRPLLAFSHGAYRLCIDHPGSPQQSPSVPSPLSDPMDSLFMSQLRDAFVKMTERFRDHRDAEGLTASESRMIWQIEQNPDSSVDMLARAAMLAYHDAEDAIEGLLRYGYVGRSVERSMFLTPQGRTRLIALRQRAHAFEAALLSSVGHHDVDAARRVMKKIAQLP